jgi:anaerobic selenocysteine-containing dehydrogenase
VDVPLADAYSWLLHVSRRLYDQGVAMRGSPALAGLQTTTSLQLNHLDLDRLGVVTGDTVSVSGPRGTFTLSVVLNDAVARGVSEVAFGSLSDDGVDVVRSLLERTAVVTQVRLETR